MIGLLRFSPLLVFLLSSCGVHSSLAAGKRGAALNGIDVLSADGFKALDGLKVGLITNHTGIDRKGKPTIDLLHGASNVTLVSLFSPEHGIRGTADHSNIKDGVDQKTGLKIHSLYSGEKRKPSAAQLRGLDALVFDIQDIGCRFTPTSPRWA